MKISEITSTLEEFAPLALQAAYDNSGLQVGRADTEVSSVLVCVDVTAEVLKEAETSGVELVIAHHPMIFNPLRRLTDASRAEALAAQALRAGIAIYACHTNLDAAPHGMSHRLAQWLRLENVRTLEPAANAPVGFEGAGFGVIGELPQSEDAEEFLRRVAHSTGLEALRHSEIHRREVKKVALCTGAGDELIPLATASGADIFLTADIRHHNFLDAVGRITIADIGHHESELCAVELICEVIRKKMPTFAVRQSATAQNPVKYIKI